MAIRWSAKTLEGRAAHKAEVEAGKPCYWGAGHCPHCRGESLPVEYEGRVLAINVHGGSFNDGYDHGVGATVWFPEHGEARYVSYGSTMGIDAAAEVDATPEVRAAYETAERAREAAARHRRALLDSRIPRKGMTVRVVRGRKVAKGTEGVVIWYGDGRFGARVGIKDAAGEVHWTAAHNVETLNWLAAVESGEVASAGVTA